MIIASLYSLPVKSLITFIEGNTNAIQNLLLVANEQGSYALSEEDRIALSEINVTIDSRGKASALGTKLLIIY